MMARPSRLHDRDLHAAARRETALLLLTASIRFVNKRSQNHPTKYWLTRAL